MNLWLIVFSQCCTFGRCRNKSVVSLVFTTFAFSVSIFVFCFLTLDCIQLRTSPRGEKLNIFQYRHVLHKEVKHWWTVAQDDSPAADLQGTGRGAADNMPRRNNNHSTAHWQWYTDIQMVKHWKRKYWVVASTTVLTSNFKSLKLNLKLSVSLKWQNKWSDPGFMINKRPVSQNLMKDEETEMTIMEIRLKLHRSWWLEPKMSFLASKQVCIGAPVRKAFQPLQWINRCVDAVLPTSSIRLHLAAQSEYELTEN